MHEMLHFQQYNLIPLVTALSKHLFNEFSTLKGAREAGLEHSFNLFANINLLGLLQKDHVLVVKQGL